MKKFLYVFLVTVMVCAAKPAAAFETQAEDPAQRTLLGVMGQAFAPAAMRLGAPVFAAADYSDPEHRSALLEYLPEGQPLKGWTRMVSVAVYNLEEDPEQQQSTMMAVAGGLYKAFVTHGRVLQVQHYMNNKSEPGMFIEFEIGEGAATEHNAAVFMRTSKRAAAFIQLQSRGKRLTADDVLAVHKMITPNPEPGKPPSAETVQKMTAPDVPAVPAMPQPPKMNPEDFFASQKPSVQGAAPEPILIPVDPAPDAATNTPETAEESVIPPDAFNVEPEWRTEGQPQQQAVPQKQAEPAASAPAKSWLDRN